MNKEYIAAKKKEDIASCKSDLDIITAGNEVVAR